MPQIDVESKGTNVSMAQDSTLPPLDVAKLGDLKRHIEQCWEVTSMYDT